MLNGEGNESYLEKAGSQGSYTGTLTSLIQQRVLLNLKKNKSIMTQKYVFMLSH